MVKQWMLKDWNTFLAEMTAIFPLVNGAIYSIYSAKTHEKLRSLQEVCPDCCYIAVGREKMLKPLYYPSAANQQGNESNV